MAELAERGAIPLAIPATAQGIYEALSREPIDTQRLSRLAGNCLVWMADLVVEVDREVDKKLPQPYLELLDIALSSADGQELVAAQETAAGLAPHRKWTASYLSAHNARLPRGAADGIHDIYRHGYSGTLIRDALARREA